ESLQASLHRAAHVLSMIPTEIWILLAFRECVLGRDHKMIPVTFDKLANEFLTGSVSVVIGRVNEIAASPFGKSIENFAAFILRCTPAPVIAKSHCAKAHL